ncbi:hypothetical protein AB6A40_005726 [Gnathostoma spinigerum]|uniref:Fatty-acid and retinol-binding protein 1 n=1 Tax=Gnathostoma spinigerum TaxID=75299 RepID=A0ABD6EIH3_9BILA
MFRFIAFLTLTAVCSANSIAMLTEIPENLKEFIPEEVKQFHASLTPHDKEILKEIASKHSEYANEEAALAALKEKSPALHTKAINFRNMVKAKIDSLQPDAKAFVEESVAKAKTLRPAAGARPDLEKVKELAREIIKKYKELPEAAKASLQEKFPHCTAIIKNEKFQNLAKKFLGMTAAN